MTTMRGTRNCYYFLIHIVIQGLKALRAMSQLLLFFDTSCNYNLDEYDDNERNTYIKTYRIRNYGDISKGMMTTTRNVGADQEYFDYFISISFIF